MNKPHLLVGTLGHDPGHHLALAAAISRAGRDLLLVEPKSMQDQNAQPTEPKPVVLVDDTKAPVDPELEVKPKSSCRHCYGRGYIGTDTKTKKKILCRCVQKSFAKAEKVRNARKAEEMKLKGASVTSSKGWDEPKAPSGNKEALQPA